MSQHSIVIVEDDEAIRLGVLDALRFEGYGANAFCDGESCLQHIGGLSADLVLLDLTLPGLDGLDVLDGLRKPFPNLPVIIMTARGSENDRVRGLRKGADDYITKPFSIRELLARVEAVLRRSLPQNFQKTPEHVLGDLRFDPNSSVLMHENERLELSEKECDALAYLCHHRGRDISREELLQRVWRVSSQHMETRSVDMTVSRLRDKLQGQAHITTVRGVGYRLENPS